jgi:large subunit ribosomal protein L25
VDVVKLQARVRTGTGTSANRKIRASGWIPAVYYGHSIESRPIEVNAREFAALVRHKKTNHLIDLGLAGEGESVAIIKETQRHVLQTDFYFHIDFQHIRLDENVTVKCHVEIVGIPLGVSEDGGVLGHSTQYLMVECLPAAIPEKIIVDVSALRVGQSIHVKDVVVPGITIKDSPDTVVAVVTHASREVEVAATEESAEGEAVAADASATDKKDDKKDDKKTDKKPEKKTDKK